MTRWVGSWIRVRTVSLRKICVKDLPFDLNRIELTWNFFPYGIDECGCSIKTQGYTSAIWI